MAATIDITGELFLRQKTNDTTKPKVNSQPVDLAKSVNVTQTFDKYFESFGIQTDLELMNATSLANATVIFFQASAIVSLKINGSVTALQTDHFLLVTDSLNFITSLKITNSAAINFYLFLGK